MTAEIWAIKELDPAQQSVSTPKYFLTDTGRVFDNQVLRITLEEYGVKHVTTSPYHPQANRVERNKRTLKTMTAFVGADHRNWGTRIYEMRHAVKYSSTSDAASAPPFLNIGWHPRLVKSLRRDSSRNMADDPDPPDKPREKYFKCHPSTRFNFVVCIVCEEEYHLSDFKRQKKLRLWTKYLQYATLIQT